MRRCMAADFSWRRSAEKYVDLYYRALAARASGRTRPERCAVALIGGSSLRYRTRSVLRGPVPARIRRAGDRTPTDRRASRRWRSTAPRSTRPAAASRTTPACWSTASARPHAGRRRVADDDAVWHVAGRAISSRRPRCTAQSTGTGASTTCSSTPGSTSSRRRSSGVRRGDGRLSPGREGQHDRPRTGADLDAAALAAAEAAANEIVDAALPVTATFVSPERAGRAAAAQAAEGDREHPHRAGAGLRLVGVRRHPRRQHRQVGLIKISGPSAAGASCG